MQIPFQQLLIINKLILLIVNKVHPISELFLGVISPYPFVDTVVIAQ